MVVSNRHLLFQGSILRGELIYFQVYDMVTSQNTLPNRQPKEARWGSSRQSLQTVKHLNKRPSSLSRKDHLLNQLPLGVNIPFFQTVSKSIGFSRSCILTYTPSKGWCLNPKGSFSGTHYHPFGTPWRVQVCTILFFHGYSHCAYMLSFFQGFCS